jgi:hypothetical protein
LNVGDLIHNNRKWKLGGGTTSARQNILTLEDDVMASIEEYNNVHDQAIIRLALENIRKTAEYACDIAEVAIN